MVSRSASTSECNSSAPWSVVTYSPGAVWMDFTLPLTEGRFRRVRLLFSGILDQRVVLECQKYVSQKDNRPGL